VSALSSRPRSTSGSSVNRRGSSVRSEIACDRACAPPAASGRGPGLARRQPAGRAGRPVPAVRPSAPRPRPAGRASPRPGSCPTAPCPAARRDAAAAAARASASIAPARPEAARPVALGIEAQRQRGLAQFGLAQRLAQGGKALFIGADGLGQRGTRSRALAASSAGHRRCRSSAAAAACSATPSRPAGKGGGQQGKGKGGGADHAIRLFPVISGGCGRPISAGASAPDRPAARHRAAARPPGRRPGSPAPGWWYARYAARR
jgi:hypothetical protein